MMKDQFYVGGFSFIYNMADRLPCQDGPWLPVYLKAIVSGRTVERL